jgi:MFS family permease
MTQALLRFNGRAFASVTKHRNYRLFFLGQTISLPGTWIQRFAQAWLVLSLTHSAFAVGLLALAQFLPFTLFSLIAGVFVDRFDPRRIVLATQVMQMTLAATIAAITLSGVVRPWHVYAIAFLGGVIQVLDAPARQQLTYRMVGRRELQNAVALNSSVFNASRIYGPGLAGVLIAAFGAGICFAINAVSFLAVLAGLLMMRPSEFFSVEPSRRPTMVRGIREGISYALHSHEIRLVLILVLVISTFCLNFNVILPVLAKQTLHAGPRTFGALSAAFGLGALAGGLLAAAQGRARKSLMLIGAAGFGASELLLAAGSSVLVDCLLLLVAGISFTTWSSNSNSIVQLTAPDHLRGRVIGLYFFAFAGTGALGGVLAGWLIHVGGTRLAFAVAAVAALFSTVVIGQLLRTRTAPMKAEDATPERLAA